MIFDCFEIFKEDFFEINKEIFKDKTLEQKEASFNNVVTQYCFGLLLSTIGRISNSVGSSKLMKVYDEITQQSEFPRIRKTIALAIKMDYATSVPVDEIISFYDELVKGKQTIAAEALRHLVAEFLYYFSIKETERQKLCQNLKLNFKFLSKGRKQDIGERA